jgi:hypothetical protein
MDAAYKLSLLLTPSPDRTDDAFAEAWLAHEAADPLGAEGLLRHVFGRPVAQRSPLTHVAAAPYRAVQETWWRRKNDAAQWFVSHGFDRWLAARMPLLAQRPDAVGGAPVVLWEQPDADAADAVTVIIVPVGLRSLTATEFVAHWTGAHAELALGGPRTRERVLRLEDTPAHSTPSPFRKNRFDGVGAVTFASLDALTAEFDSPYYREEVAADEPRFSDAQFSTAFLTTPVVLSATS